MSSRWLFGTPFYAKEREYRVSYVTEVKNASREHQRGFLVTPFVSQTPTQTLLDEPTLTPQGNLQTEKIYGNTYVVWEFALEPNEEKNFKQFFKVKIAPAITTALPKFRIEDYDKLDRNLIGPYLSANDYLTSTSQNIIELSQKIRGRETNVIKIISAINEFVIGHLTYGNPIPGLYSSNDALEGKTVDCGGFDTLFVSLCQAAGIPARVVSGFWAGYHVNDMHAWAQVLLPSGTWLAADPSMEKLGRERRTRKSGKLGFLGSDRIAMSVGCDLELEAGTETFATDILQNPLVYPENMSLEVKRIFSTQPL